MIELAVKASNHRTKQEAVTAALKEDVRRRQQLDVLQLAETIDYDPQYDSKSERCRKGWFSTRASIRWQRT
ncbi:MAG: type II toxin-antitoxin system VapB family antitoxin [Dehalococcoidia bacterium]